MHINFENITTAQCYELEARAYADGSTALSQLLTKLGEALEQVEELSDQLDDANKTIANQSDYDSYKQFFEDCFARLNAHYPCPSVMSDYDCSVIFDAIERGEGTAE